MIKKTIYLSAWLFSFLFISGFLFKLLHLPGAFNLLYIGETGFSLFSIPLIFFFRWKENKLRDRLVFYQWLSGCVTAIVFISSTWLRFTSDFYANIAMTSAFVLFAFAFLPLAFYNMYRKSLLEL
ncbi:hypothetical protein [Marivirga lumbricoides]|uniref:hypothetical protein n=1 Tax=Marivirga lumbricoides TaxID=1046115 RepID=UPI0016664E8C